MLIAVENIVVEAVQDLPMVVEAFIGDGKVIDNIGRIRVTTLDDWIASFLQAPSVGFGFPPNVNR